MILVAFVEASGGNSVTERVNRRLKNMQRDLVYEEVGDDHVVRVGVWTLVFQMSF